MNGNKHIYSILYGFGTINPILCNDFSCRSKSTEKPILAVTDLRTSHSALTKKSQPNYGGTQYHRQAGILGFFRGKPIFQIFVLSSQTETPYTQNN